jgi:hypothetical protein
VIGWNRGARRALAVSGVAVLLGIAGIAAQNAKPAAVKYPPQFPREGATKLFENEHVIVWEQIGRPKEALVHKHLRDILYFPIEPGRHRRAEPGWLERNGKLADADDRQPAASLDELLEGGPRAARRSDDRPEPARPLDFRGDQGHGAQGLSGVEYGV